jgi:hypothetical protein
MKRSTVPDISLIIGGRLWTVFKVSRRQLAQHCGEEDLTKAPAGLTSFSQRRIMICSDLTSSVALDTLLHEIGHASLEAISAMPQSYNQGTVDIELAVELGTNALRCAMAYNREISKFAFTFTPDTPFIRYAVEDFDS